LEFSVSPYGSIIEFLDDTTVVKTGATADTKIGTAIVLNGKSRKHTIVATAPGTENLNDSQVWKFVVIATEGEEEEEPTT
jgi:hypothetical protein